MLKFVAVVFGGFLFGSVCGFLVGLPMIYSLTAAEGYTPLRTLGWTLTGGLMWGAALGGPVGCVAFSICYAMFLAKIPLKLALAVTIPSTVVGGWLGVLLQNRVLASGVMFDFWSALYGPPIAALIISSAVLFSWQRRRLRASTRV